MHFEGSFEIKASIDKVYDTLSSPDAVAKSLPDVQSLEILSEDRFKAKFKVGVSYIRGTVSMDFTIAEKVQNKHAKLVGHGSGLQSSMDIETSFDLSEKEGGKTTVDWVAESKVGGLIAGVGSKMLGSASEKQIQTLIDSIKAQLEQG